MPVQFVENDATNREENAHIIVLILFEEVYILDKFNRLTLIIPLDELDKLRMYLLQVYIPKNYFC